LLNRRTGFTGTEGSNPSVSAKRLSFDMRRKSVLRARAAIIPANIFCGIGYGCR
jgi:hypothetical protein